MCAFSYADTLTFTVRVPRVFCANHVSLELYRDSDMSRDSFALKLAGFGDSTDDFEIKIEAASLPKEGESGLFYYTFSIETIYGKLFVNRDGSLTDNFDSVDCTQLSIFEDSFKTPDRFKGGMMYQIFPDRFAKSGRPIKLPMGRILNEDWENGIPQFADRPGGEVANNMFFGGDLFAIADRLEYIKSLGVDILYLCPIFEAASNHRYDTGDYMKVDPLLGGEEGLDYLINKVKEQEMKIILDGVFNHTGVDSKYFNKFRNYRVMGAYNSMRSPYYRWYKFAEYPDKYDCWWGVKILPAVKSDEPSYREFICSEDGVIRHYLKKGIDGWRLDVADELSDIFLDELRSAAKSEKSDSLILGEVWEDASNKVAYDKRRRYFGGAQLDSVMNYPLKEAVIDFVLGGDSSNLSKTAEILYTHYPKEVSDVLMNFLGTHDTERILTTLADVNTAEMTNAELSNFRLTSLDRRKATDRLKLAWALLCAFPGIPCIYYGDEIGMEGGRDPFNRMPFDPKKADKDLTAFYRGIGAIRCENRVFRDGDFEIIDSGDPGQFMFTRSDKDTKIAVCINLTPRVWQIEFDKIPERLLGSEECGYISCLSPYSIEYFKITV